MGTGHFRRRPVRISVPSRADPLLMGFTELLGGPLGRRCSPGKIDPGAFTVERVLILLTIAAALLSVLIKNSCRTAGWSTPGQYYMACYSQWPEVFALLQAGTPFLELELPVLAGALAVLTALLVPTANVSQYFDLNATLIAVVWLVTVIATVRMANRRPWDAAMVAVAPMLILAGTNSWALWAVMLGALGMLAFARSRFIPAGILLGLGTAVAGYPVLIYGAVLLLALRTRKFRGAALTGGALSGAWLAVNLPFAVNDAGSWSHYVAYSVAREADYSSAGFAYNALAQRAGTPTLDASTVNTGSLVLLGIACAGVAALTLLAPRRPRLAQVALLLVGALVLTGKEYAPEYAIWLIPLVALAYPGWRSFLVWQLFEAAHWWALWMYLGRETSGGEVQHNLDTPYYVFAVLGHMAATAYIMYRVAETILDPRQDPVRRLDIDDPQGGPFDHAEDGWRPVRRRRARVRLTDPSPPLKDPL